MAEWLQVIVRVTPEAVEAAGELLRQAGASGWESRGAETLVGYIPAGSGADARVAALQARVRALKEAGLDPGPAEVRTVVVTEQPWAEVWKAYFRPTRVGRVLLSPTWEQARPTPGEVLVRLDPGMAFGSGAHATTRLCLLALQEELRPGGRVLDVGTGSGILAIAAACLGASRALAVDNDPEVLPIARANAAQNGVADAITFIEGEIAAVTEGGWDVIVANIAPGPVMQAAAPARRLLASSGAFIGAGIPAARADEVRASLTESGLGVERTLQEAEWVAIVARKHRD
ncbi:MAG: 50S ribosomal protein L11 methyltransferase [Armatimonadetes bacterium]|nr:50S ribosomal protein L11 methyltransferase [Armatimonadota bacterium]